MKRILIMGAGKSATHLVAYLLDHAGAEDWELTLADANFEMAVGKINGHARGNAMALDILNENERIAQIEKADIVISMLPPTLHGIVAVDCLKLGRNLLTASYVDDHLRSMQSDIAQKGLLFLCEMGLDPGIDHMSAMEMIHKIQDAGGSITSFRSHCGGLVAPESDDNPWHYKISWNPRNIIMAGKAGAHYRVNGEEVHVSHLDLFTDTRKVSIPDLGTLCWYPNRDSLGYEAIYGLKNTPSFVRTTLRYPDFMSGWKNIVELNLTEEAPLYDGMDKSMSAVLQQHLDQKGLSEKLAQMLMQGKEGEVSVNKGANSFQQQWNFLGMNDTNWILNKAQYSPADLLQTAVEKKLALLPHDKDMIVMLHELEYLENHIAKKWSASLIVKGEDSTYTAMSKTVGLPLGISCRLILNGTIQSKGLCIPTSRDIYEPVLKELEEFEIRFDHWKI